MREKRKLFLPDKILPNCNWVNRIQLDSLHIGRNYQYQGCYILGRENIAWIFHRKTPNGIGQHFCNWLDIHHLLKLEVYKRINTTVRNTGCPRSKVSKVKGCSLVTVHIWPNIGKAKMCLRNIHFFCKSSCLYRNHINTP